MSNRRICYRELVYVAFTCTDPSHCSHVNANTRLETYRPYSHLRVADLGGIPVRCEERDGITQRCGPFPQITPQYGRVLIFL